MPMPPTPPAPVAPSYGYAGGPPEQPPSRSFAIAGGILALLGGLGHAFIGLMLLVVGAFLVGFLEAFLSLLPDDQGARREAYAILVALFVYTGLSVLSCVPAILATLGRYWAVLATAIFHGVLGAALAVLTIHSGESLVGLAAAYSGLTLLLSLLGLGQARAHGDYERRRRELMSGIPGYR